MKFSKLIIIKKLQKSKEEKNIFTISPATLELYELKLFILIFL